MKNSHARKKRQLKALANQLHQLILNSGGKTNAEIKRVIARMRSLILELRHRISHTDLRKALGAAALFFGLAATPQTVEAQNFLPPVQNPFGIQQSSYINVPATADLDGDGDMDVLIGEYYGSMAYYENIGSATNPQFAAPVNNPFGLDSVLEYAFPEFADIDNDGDMDLLVGEYYGNFQFFRNVGTPTAPSFAPAQQNPFGIQSSYYFGVPSFADLDNDGDLDLLIGEYYGNMKYFQNIGSASAPLFGAPVDNPFGLTSTYEFAFVDFGDLDNDGDFDLMVGEYYGNFQYFENNGNASNPQFVAPLQNPFGLSGTGIAFPQFVDLDDDGDLDMLVGAYYGVVNYYENGTPQSVAETSERFSMNLFPNPTENELNIASSEKIELIEILDLTGRLITSVQNSNNKIDVSTLPNGSYIIRLTNSEGKLSSEKFQKL